MDREFIARRGDHSALRIWLRLLTCTQLIERRVRSGLREEFATTLPRFDLMAQLERHPEGLRMNELAVEKVSKESREDPFRVLVATMLSAQTKDAVTDRASTRLFRVARTPRVMARRTSSASSSRSLSCAGQAELVQYRTA